MEMPTRYKNRDYSKVINEAIYRAMSRYDYPDSSAGMGLKKLLGRGYYAMLLEEEICGIKIPIKLKIELMGEKQYYERCK